MEVNLLYGGFSNDEDAIWYRGYDSSQEIVSARTFNTKVFRTKNENRVYRIFSHPVHFINESGMLEDIEDSCSCCFDWQIDESYSGYADELFEEKNICGVHTNYIQVNDTYYYRGFVEFNTEAIPDTATIDSVELNLNCVQWPVYTEDHDIWSMESQPSSSGALTIYNDAANGNCYVSNYIGGTGLNSWDLGPQACQDMEDLLLEDWFAVGISGWYSASAYYLLYECGSGWIDAVEPVGVKEEFVQRPTGLFLSQNHPNPFTTTTTIKLILPGAQEHKSTGAQAKNIELKIYDVTGKLVKDFSLGTDHLSLTTAVSTAVSWNGTDDDGSKVPNGTYFYQLKAGSKSITKKMTLIR